MRNFDRPRSEEEPTEETPACRLGDFDMEYFRELEGEDGWIAIGQENCSNQRYFTVHGEKDGRLGIVGMYDTDDERNITHTVVDSAHRGKGLSAEFKERLLDATGEDHYVATVDLDNASSLRSMQNTEGVEVVSDEEYERKYHKRKFRYERTQE
ncbi:hypothetical protein ACFLZO_00850 [Patescibacteria group bacterium]